MKTFLLMLMILLGPTTARATLFSYELSVTMLAEYLVQPIYGDVRVGVFFPQETRLDYPYSAFQLPDLAPELRPWYSINGYRNVGYWSLSAVTPTDFRIWVGDPGGNVYFDLLYDHIQSLSGPFREPDRLGVSFGYELGEICIPFVGCSLGTGGSHTFARDEFSFIRTHAAVVEPYSFLLLGAGFVVIGIVGEKRRRKKNRGA